MKSEIVNALRDIETHFGVRVLMAVESGSRAWGFASPDSDYDVRFVYVHPRDWYIAVQEQRDVIEKMLPGDLDVSGWELRKSLRLFSKCNLALNEWIGSPIVYASDERFVAQMRGFLPAYFNPIAGIHHYLKMAEHALDENFVDGTIGIKKLFYVLRPLLACRWIRNKQTQPPTEFAQLVETEWVSAAEQRWIGDLLTQKAEAVEAHRIPLERERVGELLAELKAHAAFAATLKFHKPPNDGALDALLREWVSRFTA